MVVISFLRLQKTLQANCGQVVANFAKMVCYGAVSQEAASFNLITICRLIQPRWVRRLFVFRGNMKVCSFFGYRDFKPTEEMEAKVYEIIENLIDKGVNRFLFGSRSDFDTFCHGVVTKLQEKYPNIVRVSYLCKHERSCLIGEGKDEEEWLKRFAKIDVNASLSDGGDSGTPRISVSI